MSGESDGTVRGFPTASENSGVDEYDSWRWTGGVRHHRSWVFQTTSMSNTSLSTFGGPTAATTITMTGT